MCSTRVARSTLSPSENGTKSSTSRMKPYDEDAVPYATLPKLSTGGVEICIGNRFSPHSLDQESVQRISVSAVTPEYATADHEVLFEDGEGAEGEDEISIAKKKIKEGADLVGKSVKKLQSSKRTGRKVVIVHCYAGQNRSAAIISAYAIRKRGWTPKPIKDYLRRQIKKQRNVTAVLQNKAFRQILGM